MVQVYRNIYGKVSLVLRQNPETGKNEWVRPGTNEVDSRSPPPRDWSAPPNVNVGARPKPGDLRPSEPLLRSLGNAQREADERRKAERFARLEQLERDIASGKLRVHDEAKVGGDNVILERDGSMHVVPRENAPERELWACEVERAVKRAGASEAARRNEAERQRDEEAGAKREAGSPSVQRLIAEANERLAAAPPPPPAPVAVGVGHDPRYAKPEAVRGLSSPEALLDPRVPGIANPYR